jgi:hypothetical protein
MRENKRESEIRIVRKRLKDDGLAKVQEPLRVSTALLKVHSSMVRIPRSAMASQHSLTQHLKTLDDYCAGCACSVRCRQWSKKHVVSSAAQSTRLGSNQKECVPKGSLYALYRATSVQRLRTIFAVFSVQSETWRFGAKRLLVEPAIIALASHFRFHFKPNFEYVCI